MNSKIGKNTDEYIRVYAGMTVYYAKYSLIIDQLQKNQQVLFYTWESYKDNTDGIE